MHTQLAQFVPAVLTSPVTLPESEKQALDRILGAARLLDPIFERQAFAGNPALREKLARDTTALGKERLALFRHHARPLGSTAPLRAICHPS